MFLDLEKVYTGGRECHKDSAHIYRYKIGNHCVECARESQGTHEPKICACGNEIAPGKKNTECDNCRRYLGDTPENISIRKAIRARFRRTGFTANMFDECWKIQEGRCGLCGCDLAPMRSIDIHADHEPGSHPKKPRGILCRRCNSAWLGILEYAERIGACKITSPQLIEWQTHPPMSRSSFAEELGWLVCA